MSKEISENFTYEKVYKQGLNINTPINLELQKIATNSLRNGLILYDQRKGWRGPLTSKIYSECQQCVCPKWPYILKYQW